MKKKKQRFVVLEGLSGSGKTTVGQILASEIGAVFYKTPPPLFQEIRDRIDREADLLARFLFYLAGVVHSSGEIVSLLREKSVVCDRYLLTTICYHGALGVGVDSVLSILSSSEAVLAKPDFTFLIVCEEAKRRQRLQKRGLSFNDEEEVSLQIEGGFLEQYRRHGLTEIDNSDDNPRQAVEAIVRFMQCAEMG